MKTLRDENAVMYFVSMVGADRFGGQSVIRRNKGASFGLAVTPEMLSGEGVEGGLYVDTDKGDVLRWGITDKNISSCGLSKVEGSVNYSHGVSYEAVKSTEENPVLYVLCDEIKLFQGISAELKLVRLDNGMFLAALITGACIFNGAPLQRCNSANLDIAKVAKTLHYDDLFGDTSPLGKSLGDRATIAVDYSYDCVCHGVFMVKADGSYSVKSDKDKEYIFDDTYKNECEEKARQAKEIEKKRQEEIKARKEAEKKAYEEAKLAKERREAEKRQAEADLKMSGVKVGKSDKVVSVGAADFLKAVASLNK